jgi:transposase InsO family protein
VTPASSLSSAEFISHPGELLSRCTARLVHGDLCGPITPATTAGRRFFLLLVDDATRYMWLTLLSTKGDAASTIKVAAELEVGRPLRVVRTDNSGEFIAKEFVAYCSDEGVQRHFSALYTPQQNRVNERQNETVLGTSHTLQKERDMPTRF